MANGYSARLQMTRGRTGSKGPFSIFLDPAELLVAANLQMDRESSVRFVSYISLAKSSRQCTRHYGLVLSLC